MANENKKINELVSGNDDATSELEALTVRQFEDGLRKVRVLESEENTFDFSESDNTIPEHNSLADLQAELKEQAATIDRLQYEYEQLHARSLGLRAEVDTRQQLNEKLGAELRSREASLAQAIDTLRQRDQVLDGLQTRIRDRDLKLQNLARLVDELKIAKAELESGDEISEARQKLVEYEGAIAGLNAAFSGLQNQQRQTEHYADELRRQLADLRAESQSAVSERAALRVELSNAESNIAALEAQLVSARDQLDRAERDLFAAHQAHEQELRALRFELGESQETLTENSQLNEQLTSELAENRGYKLELERMLTDVEARGQTQIDKLEGQIHELESSIADYESKLEAKNNAINALLEEVARQKPKASRQQLPIDAEFGEEVGTTTASGRPHPMPDRVTRLLIGHIDQQELRFPLFKNRLTIGRTQQNDIFLKAQFISRRHAVVVTEGDSTRIIDWGSKNGVYVNSKRVTEHFLKSGDKVAIGTVEFRYEELPKRDPA
ncbi:MAG TPA: FHA domain-containing protein [Woeseiaceae bacterium]|nr:FHA domain-containing protein [Woeseiaceae bacterium]